jgi:hypothetical protein
MSPDPYHHAFEEELDLCKLDIGKHKTAGLSFFESNDRLLLAVMSTHTPGARIPCWRTNLCGAWLIQINDTPIHSIAKAHAAFKNLHRDNTKSCTLLFAHPKINCNISNNGLPIMNQCNFTQLTLDQLNNHKDLLSHHESLNAEL